MQKASSYPHLGSSPDVRPDSPDQTHAGVEQSSHIGTDRWSAALERNNRQIKLAQQFEACRPCRFVQQRLKSCRRLYVPLPSAYADQLVETLVAGLLARTHQRTSVSVVAPPLGLREPAAAQFFGGNTRKVGFDVQDRGAVEHIQSADVELAAVAPHQSDDGQSDEIG